MYRTMMLTAFVSEYTLRTPGDENMTYTKVSIYFRGTPSQRPQPLSNSPSAILSPRAQDAQLRSNLN